MCGAAGSVAASSRAAESVIRRFRRVRSERDSGVKRKQGPPERGIGSYRRGTLPTSCTLREWRTVPHHPPDGVLIKGRDNMAIVKECQRLCRQGNPCRIIAPLAGRNRPGVGVMLEIGGSQIMPPGRFCRGAQTDSPCSIPLPHTWREGPGDAKSDLPCVPPSNTPPRRDRPRRAPPAIAD